MSSGAWVTKIDHIVLQINVAAVVEQVMCNQYWCGGFEKHKLSPLKKGRMKSFVKTVPFKIKSS